MKSKDILQ